jgi:hypothetical protein
VFLMICCALTAWMWLRAGGQVMQRTEFLADGVRTEAVLLGYRDDYTLVAAYLVDDPMRVVRAEVRHTTPYATRHGSSSKWSRQRTRAPGEDLRMQVLYLPSQPENALLVPPRRWMLWVSPTLWFVYGCLPMIALLYLRWLGRGDAERSGR